MPMEKIQRKIYNFHKTKFLFSYNNIQRQNLFILHYFTIIRVPVKERKFTEKKYFTLALFKTES